MAAQIQASPDLTPAAVLTGEVAKRVPFIAAPVFRLPIVPSSVLARDLDGDGKVDLIVAFPATQQISVYMGLGQNRFSEPLTYSVGGHPVSIATADIFGNGKQDIVTANGTDGTVSVLAGAGGGKFAAARVYSTGVSADLLSLGDLSGAGKQDLVVATLSGKTFSVLLNDGHGSFQGAVIHALTSTPAALSVSDFNNDRQADIAFANTDGTVTMLLGEGSGTFASAKSFSVSSGKLSLLVAGDFNRDGKVDLAVAQPDGHVVSIFSGQGDGTFVRGASYQTGNGPIAASTADLRGNGLTDLVTVNRASNTFSVLMGNGDGTFQDAMNFTAGDGPVQVAPGDFEGSGLTGLAIINASARTVSVVAGNGDGSFKAAPSYASDLSPRSIVSGDLNGDGRPDLLVTNFCGFDAACLKGSTLTTFLATASGGYRAASSRLAGNGVDRVILIDVNGDKALDAVVLSRIDKTVSVLLGKGDGTFKDPIVTSLPEVPVALVAGDIDGDGKTDLAIATDCASSPCAQRGTLRLLLGSGDGKFRTGQVYSIGFSPVSIAAGTLSKGGSLDLVVANRCGDDATCKSAGSVTVLAGDGKGGFVASPGIAFAKNLSSIALADLRGANVLDLAVSQDGDNSVVVRHGNGDGTFQASETYAVGSLPRSTVIADFDGDGYPDIAVSNHGDSTVSVLFGKGDGTFESASTYAVGAGPESMTSVLSYGRAASLVTANANLDAETSGKDLTQLANIHPQVTPPAPTVVITNTTTSPFVYGTLLPTLTVTVTGATGSPQPDGTVTFSDSANSGSPVVLCTTAALAAGGSANQGTASCSSSTVPVGGSHSITAEYTAGASGNYSSAPSQSPFSQPVSAFAPGVAVSSTQASPQPFGTIITFIATVTGVTTSGAAQPTGTVQFTDGISGAPLACTAGSTGTVPLTASATNSTASCSTAALSGGDHHIFATYVPATTDKNYLQEESLAPGYPFSVSAVTPTVSVASTPASQQYLDGLVTFKATVTGPAGAVKSTGTVEFKDNGTDITGCASVTLSDGANSTASCPTSALALGDHTITATYTPAVTPPDTNYGTSSGTETPTFTIVSIPTTVTLSPVSNSSPPNALQPNQTDIFTATIATTTAAKTAGSPEPGVSDGTVSFQLSINGGAATTPCPSAPLVAVTAGATATCSINGLAFGNDVITATYNPASNNHFGPASSAPSNQLVAKGSINISVGPLATATVNSKPTLTATVSVNPNAPTPSGGTVGFTAQYNNTNLCSASLPAASAFTTSGSSKSAQVSCTLANPLTLPSNSSPGYSINATYDGTNDINYSGGAGTGTLIVDSATPTVTISPASSTGVINQALTFTATVAPSTGQAIPSKGSVTFTANGTTKLCSLPVAPTVPCTVSNLPVTPSGQSNSIVAAYDGQGDPSFGPASSAVPASAAISPGMTQTSLSSSQSTNQSAVNQPVTFTAKVTQAPSPAFVGNVTPTGTIAFMNGSQLLDSVNCPVMTLTSPNVSATCTTSSLPAATYQVTAVYTPPATGTANFVTSTSAPITYIVGTANTTVTVSTPGTTTVNEQVTLEATISIASGVTQPNGGTVRFTLTPVNPTPGSVLTCTSAPIVEPALKVTCPSSNFSPAGANNGLQAGSYNVSAQYLPGAGDPNFSASPSSVPKVLTVNQAVGVITLSPLGTTASPIVVVATNPTSFLATVTPNTGFPLSGTLSFVTTGGDMSKQTCQSSSASISQGSNTATCSITFSQNTSNTAFAIGLSYAGDNNYIVASPAPEMFSVQDFTLGIPSITYSNPPPNIPAGANIIYVTQGFSTDPTATNADPFFKGTISAPTTAWSSYSRPLTYSCKSTLGDSAGVACTSPAGTTAFTPVVPLSFSASTNSPAGDYSYQLTGTDASLPSLSRSAGAVILRVVAVTPSISLSATGNQSVVAAFTIPAGVLSHGVTYSCGQIFDVTTKTMLKSFNSFSCTVPDPKVNSFNVGLPQTASSQVYPVYPRRDTYYSTMLFGVPFLVLGGCFIRRKLQSRNFSRLLGLLFLIACLLQVTGCGSNGGFVLPPSSPGSNSGKGVYQVQVTATDGTATYYSVIQVSVGE